MLRSSVTASEWGLYWLRCALRHPEHALACHWNTVMEALNVMALEANPHPHEVA